MKLLSIGTDRKLFEEGSAVLERTLRYAKAMEELHIVVFATREHGLENKQIGNLYLYPTNSRNRFWYISDANKIGQNVLTKFQNPAPMSDIGAGGVVISTQDPFETGWVGLSLKKKFNLPLQIQVHTDFLSESFKNNFLNRVRVMMSKWVIPKADGIRVVSEGIRDSMSKRFSIKPETIEVLPVFVDIEKMIEGASKEEGLKFPESKFTILVASRLEKEKRIDVAIEVFRDVLDKLPFAGLVIAGSGSQKAELEKKVRNLGMSERVVFVGWQKDLLPYYKGANLFLLTSEYEGYGQTLIEAGASGCPIVTTSVGLAKTDMFHSGSNSFVCPVGDRECLVNSVMNLISDNSKRELFKREMQDSIKKVVMSEEVYVEKYVSLLQNLIKNA